MTVLTDVVAVVAEIVVVVVEAVTEVAAVVADAMTVAETAVAEIVTATVNLAVVMKDNIIKTEPFLLERLFLLFGKHKIAIREYREKRRYCSYPTFLPAFSWQRRELLRVA